MPSTAVYLNDFDLSTLGIAVEEVVGWLDTGYVQDYVVEAWGRVGGVIGATDPRVGGRKVRVRCFLRPSTMAAGREILNQVKSLASAGLIELRCVDETDRYAIVRLGELVVPTSRPQFANREVRFELSFNCVDPYRYDSLASLVGVTSTNRQTPVPLGTAPSAPIIRVLGAATNPTLNYRSVGGTSKQTMGFTITLAAADYLEINCDTFVITKSVSGVVTSAIDTLTSGDFIAFDPQDGDYVNNGWPTIETNQGTLQVLYRRAWQ